MFSLFWTADDSVSIAKNPSVTAMLDLGESGSFAYLIIAGKKKQFWENPGMSLVNVASWFFARVSFLQTGK